MGFSGGLTTLKISLRFAKFSRGDCRPTLSGDTGISGHSSRGLFGDGVGEIRSHSGGRCEYGEKERDWMRGWGVAGTMLGLILQKWGGDCVSVVRRVGGDSMGYLRTELVSANGLGVGTKHCTNVKVPCGLVCLARK